MNMVLERWSRGGRGSLKIGAAGCRSSLRPSRAALVCGIGYTESVNTSRHLESTTNHSKTWQHEGETAGMLRFCSKCSYFFLRIHLWNFLNFAGMCEMQVKFLPKVSCIGCNRALGRCIPRVLGDAARHPEVSAGCLDVFTGLMESENEVNGSESWNNWNSKNRATLFAVLKKIWGFVHILYLKKQLGGLIKMIRK